MTGSIMRGRPITAMWVHGNTVIPERPSDFTDIRHLGSGAELVFRAGEGDPPGYVESFLHIPIPTPALINGAPADLAKVFLLYETDTQGATEILLKSLEMWDGQNLLERQDLYIQLPTGPTTQHWYGSHITMLDQDNTVVLSQPKRVHFGLGLFLLCHSSTGPGTLRIAAAGADFLTGSLHLDIEKQVRVGEG
jgi:hypothetical protein